jgi:hypothetical protein
MFSFKKSNPQFQFYSSVPGVKEQFPIIESKEYKRKWVAPVANSYKTITDDLNNYGKPFTGVAKCPGIFGVLHTGWIVTSWFDFIIETKDNGKSVGYRVPPFLKDNLSSNSSFDRSLINIMNLELPQMKIPIPPQSLNLLIKISTPWHVEIPKGWNLLIVPVSYSDENRFTSSTGILRPGDEEINPQLFWHQLNGVELIPAGTPLCQLIPVPDKTINFNFNCLDFTEKQTNDRAASLFKNSFGFVKK